MMIVLPPLLLSVLATRVIVTPKPTRPWTNHESIPNDPNLSCYMLQNKTWNCAEDVLLRRDVDDNDDSY
tara:strand:+ start:140 stop:346 length:207 start_codon:yes stop_codon:yes gene_type:complete